MNEIDHVRLKERKGSSQILVHVLKASNLPVRCDQTPLEAFVEVSFVDEKCRSRCEEGSSPAFFQSLAVDFAPLDFEEDTLSIIDDDIVLVIFDKVKVDMLPSMVARSVTPQITNYRTERRYLGCVRIPFYSLFNSVDAAIEGTFDVDVPRWVNGYQLQPVTTHSRPSLHMHVYLKPPLRKTKSHPLHNRS